MSPPARDHPLRRQLATQDHPVDVDVQDSAGYRVWFVDNPPHGHDAGVVDQHVDRAELALDGVEESRKRIRVGDIEFAVHVEVEIGTRLFRHRLIDVADRDLGSQVVQRGRCGQSDPRAPPVMAITLSWTLSRILTPMDVLPGTVVPSLGGP